jgi:hypothetical protein
MVIKFERKNTCDTIFWHRTEGRRRAVLVSLSAQYKYSWKYYKEEPMTKSYYTAIGKKTDTQ